MKLAMELGRLGRADQVRRKKFRPGDTWNDMQDRENVRRLKAIVKRYGWPTISKVGPVASRAAWLVAQHAAFDKPFQKLALREMIRAHTRNKKDIEDYQLAYLTDRLLVEDGKPQLFGTQFKIFKNEVVKPSPIKDKARLDDRRAAYGLEPFAAYLRSARNSSKKK